MAEVGISTTATHPAATAEWLNVANRLSKIAARSPDRVAVVCPRRRPAGYETITFGELDADATRIARGLVDWGVAPGTRLALLVRPGIDFVTLVFALLRTGAVMVLVDPGLGWKNLTRCLVETEPQGFVAIPRVHAIRKLLGGKFPLAKWNVTVGRRWFWGGPTLDELRRRGDASYGVRLPEMRADASAAIIFTSGSTGPAKGVLYTQRMFDTQVAEIQSMYDIAPGGIDLSCFPLFALFNSAMGVTTVLPEMDFARPASADPERLLAAANDWKVTQAFASPAVWRNLGCFCSTKGKRIESLRQIFSCGAPVPADVLRATLEFAAPGAKMHTPYGATECLPVATIEAAEVLAETAIRTDQGAGVCVGRRFDSIEWRVIRITDDSIARIEEADELPVGKIGELVVRGRQASPHYATRSECNAAAKIVDATGNWHRMGDVGYLDEMGRFWYCGRKSQRVETRNGPIFTEKIEAVFNSLPGVRRSALVGVGPDGLKHPAMIIEPVLKSMIGNSARAKQRQSELIDHWYDVEPRIETLWYAEHGYTPLKSILFRRTLPVDVRHNAKINREELTKWVAAKFPELA